MAEELNDGLKLGTVKLGSQEVILRHPRDEDSENCITVSVSPNEHRDKVVQLAVDEIKRTRWWLQDYWERKALPVQQVELSDGVHQVTVYSWGQQVQETQLAIFAKVFRSFTGVKNGFIFNHFRYLLIDDNQPTYGKTGRPQNGVAREDLGTITLFPNAFQDTPSVLAPNLSHLEWTLAHECSHGLEVIPGTGMDQFIDRWKKVGGWSRLYRAKVLPGGAMKIWETSTPERCISDGARLDYQEDLAESGTAYVFIPAILDPVKRSFLEEEVPFDRVHQLQWQIVSRPTEATLPIIPNEFKIKTVPVKAVVIKDIRTGTD